MRRIIICALLFLSLTPHVEAAYLYLDPTSGSLGTDKRLEVKVKINTEGEKPTTSDAIIIFDPAKLKVIEVKEPQQSEKFFPRFFLNNKTSKIFIGSAIQPQGTPESGDGLIATIVFEGVANGSTTVSIQCEEGKTTDSNITLKKNQRVTDIIECGKIHDATFIVGTGTANPSPTTGIAPSATPKPSTTGSPLPTTVPSITTKPSPSLTPTKSITPTPSISPTPTVLPTPSSLPDTGDITPTSIAIAIGLGLTLISILIKIFI